MMYRKGSERRYSLHVIETPNALKFSVNSTQNHRGSRRGRLELTLPREQVRAQLSSSLVEDAEIVFTTLSSSGLQFIAKSSGFDTLVIDEACQAVEAASLIPLHTGVSRCVMVGDPRQLPATVLSQEPGAALYQRSLFERLEQAGAQVHMLKVQYRMHQSIREFPSAYFYGGGLRDGPNVQGRKSFVEGDFWFRPMVYYDVASKESRPDGKSVCNVEEAEMCSKLLGHLFTSYGQMMDLRGKVAILTPYRQQMNKIIEVV